MAWWLLWETWIMWWDRNTAACLCRWPWWYMAAEWLLTLGFFSKHSRQAYSPKEAVTLPSGKSHIFLTGLPPACYPPHTEYWQARAASHFCSTSRVKGLQTYLVIQGISAPFLWADTNSRAEWSPWQLLHCTQLLWNTLLPLCKVGTVTEAGQEANGEA